MTTGSRQLARCPLLAKVDRNLVSRVSGLRPSQSLMSFAARTWSYSSETYTYPIMRSQPRKEKRVERKVIDGVEQDVEVEVEIEEPIKRLFLFGGARD